MRSTVVATGVTATCAGSRSIASASLAMSFGMVAEKNRVWRCLRQLGDDLADRRDEAHVEHAVGFVEHEESRPGRASRPLLCTRSSRRPGVATRMSTPLASARGPGGPSARRRTTTRRRSGACGGRRRGSSRRSGRPVRGSGAAPARGRPCGCGWTRFCEQAVQDRQREGGGLAGAGLGDAEHVAAGQCDGDGLGLDGRGREVILFFERTRDGIGEAEILKGGQKDVSFHYKRQAPGTVGQERARGV